MPTYEVFVKPGYTSQDIVADNAEEAKQRLVEIIVDCLDTDMIEANCLDGDDEYHLSKAFAGDSAHYTRNFPFAHRRLLCFFASRYYHGCDYAVDRHAIQLPRRSGIYYCH